MGIRSWWLGYPGFWGKVDWLNHHLHCPPLVGRFGVVLVPERVRTWICDRFEAGLGEADWDYPSGVPDMDDFYVEDEPLGEVLAAFDRAEKHLTAPPKEEP